MRVLGPDKQQISFTNQHQSSISDADEFNKLLKKNYANGQKIGVESEMDSSRLVELGTLSKTTNSVAQLLLAHPQLKAKTWSIIHNDMNTNKPFQQIPVGTRIYYNNSTHELTWNPSPEPSTPALKTAHLPNDSSKAKQVEATIIPGSNATRENQQKITLGQLNHNNPTIAELLLHHDTFKSSRWHIIHAPVNKNKTFTQIPDGSTVFIDAKTKELTWQIPSQKHQGLAVDNKTGNIVNENQQAKKLDEAVKPFMGTPYKALDCYTLVVHGLKNMGVRYTGQDSLSRQLLDRARLEGRAENAYFTGEGITEAMGEKIYSKAIVQVDDVNRLSHDIYREMKQLMKKGDLLSFSLESRGHTGIISHNQDQWTYINSGRLDNSIVKNAPKHGVGEETLIKEISNWIKLAQKHRESLHITVGRLDHQRFV